MERNGPESGQKTRVGTAIAHSWSNSDGRKQRKRRKPANESSGNKIAKRLRNAESKTSSTSRSSSTPYSSTPYSTPYCSSTPFSSSTPYSSSTLYSHTPTSASSTRRDLSEKRRRKKRRQKERKNSRLGSEAEEKAKKMRKSKGRKKIKMRRVEDLGGGGVGGGGGEGGLRRIENVGDLLSNSERQIDFDATLFPGNGSCVSATTSKATTTATTNDSTTGDGRSDQPHLPSAPPSPTKVATFVDTQLSRSSSAPHSSSLSLVEGDRSRTGANSKRILAIDCEMVGVGWKMENALARCSILDERGEVLMDTYVIPPSGVASISDYRTRYSGIRRSHMRDATPFKDVQERARHLLTADDVVVVGHAVKHDFDVLGFTVPQSRVRDTSYYPYLFTLAQEGQARLLDSGCAQNANHLPKVGMRLKSLAHYVLGRRIQTGKAGHDSVEDARATLDLYKVVREKWESELNIPTPLRDLIPFGRNIQNRGDATTMATTMATTTMATKTTTSTTSSTTTTSKSTPQSRIDDDSTRLLRALENGKGENCGRNHRNSDLRINNNNRSNNHNHNRNDVGSIDRRNGSRKNSNSESSVNLTITIANDADDNVDKDDDDDVDDDGLDDSSFHPRRSRSVTVTSVTSAEMSEFVSDRYWEDFPEEETCYENY